MRLYNQLMSSVAFAPDDEKGKSDIQKERDAIKVESVEGKDTENDEQEKEDGEKEAEKESDEDEDDEKEDDAALKLQKENERLKKKLSKSEERRKIADREARALKTKLETDPDKGLTEDDVESRAEAKVTKLEFDAAQKRIIKAATKSDKDFMKKINELAEDIGLMPGMMVGFLDELDNGGEVIAHLVNHEAEAEEMWELSAPKMAIALAKISTKLERSKQKKISNAPAPITALGGNQTKNGISIYDKNWKGDDKDWIEQRQKEVAEKQKNGRYNLR